MLEVELKELLEPGRGDDSLGAVILRSSDTPPTPAKQFIFTSSIVASGFQSCQELG